MKSREFQLKPFLLKAQSYIALVVDRPSRR